MIDATVYPYSFNIYVKFRYIWYEVDNEDPFNTWLKKLRQPTTALWTWVIGVKNR